MLAYAGLLTGRPMQIIVTAISAPCHKYNTAAVFIGQYLQGFPEQQGPVIPYLSFPAGCSRRRI